MIAGDFNCVLRKKEAAKWKKEAGVSELKTLVQTNNLIDLAEDKNDGNLRYTQWQGAAHARLDRIYITGGTGIIQVAQYKVKLVPFTDHALVVASMNWSRKSKRSKGISYWKLNESVLNDEG